MTSAAQKIFENRLDILIFAAHASKPFSVKDIQETVLSADRAAVMRCLKDLIAASYTEKVTTSLYRATSMTKQLFGTMA